MIPWRVLPMLVPGVGMGGGAASVVTPNLEFTLTVSQDEFTLTADPELTTLEN